MEQALNELTEHCPSCGELRAPKARRCKYCGQFLLLGPGEPQPHGKLPGILFSLAGGLVLCGVIGLISGISFLASVQKDERAGFQSRYGDSPRAIEALRQIAKAQTQFAQQDLDRNGKQNFATLGQLGAAGLIDPDLASGLKEGYLYQVGVSARDPETRWMAVASPMVPMRTGYRHYGMNHTGQLHQTHNQRIPLTESCLFSGQGQR